MTASLALAPLLVTGSAACLVLLLGVLAGARLRVAATWTAVMASLLALIAAALALPQATGAKAILSDMWIADRMALFLDLVIAAATAMTLVIFDPFAREHDFDRGEFPALVMLVGAGMIMVVHAAHLLSLLIGIETMSLAAYVLVACRHRSSRGAEGALKYFLMGALATGF